MELAARKALFEQVAHLYAEAHPRHRYYVSAKLRTDPLAHELCELTTRVGSLGRVIDAGGGRGQFGMLLLLLDAASTLRGFDLDPSKVEAANCAARMWHANGESRSVDQSGGDLLTFDYCGGDTILLLDVLHYLPRSEQIEVLGRAAQALPAGGRLIVRETGRGSGWGAGFAQLLEKVGRAIGFNRGRTLEFLTPDEIEVAMRDIGFEVARSAPRGGLKNVLLVGTKSLS